MPRYTGRSVPSPSLPAALSSVQLILHGDGVLEQAVDALEVHAAVRHVLYGTESREGVEGGGLVNISPLWRGFRAPCFGREDWEEETSALGSALQLQPLNRLWVDLLQEPGSSAMHTLVGMSGHLIKAKPPRFRELCLHPEPPTPTAPSQLTPGRCQRSAGCFVSSPKAVLLSQAPLFRRALHLPAGVLHRVDGSLALLLPALHVGLQEKSRQRWARTG